MKNTKIKIYKDCPKKFVVGRYQKLAVYSQKTEAANFKGEKHGITRNRQ